MNAQTAPDAVDVHVEGYAIGVFAPLYNIFARMVGAQRGAGASLAIYRHGELAVDIAGGAHTPQSLQLQFSVSKAVTAIAAHHASARGLLDLDAPICETWPEFLRPSTSTITPRMVLNHTSGLAGVDVPLSIEDLVAGRYTSALEHQAPYWQPGTRHGYHAFSFGPLMDGIFAHTLGRTVGQYVAEHIAGPLNLDLWYGAPDDQAQRVTPYTREIRASTPLTRSLAALRDFEDKGSAVLGADCAMFNRADVIRQGWPNSNVICTARSLAKLMATTIGEVDGARILSPEDLERMIRRTVCGIDWVLQFPIAFGTGVQLSFPQMPLGGLRAFGHEGAGGCVAFADPDRELAVAFTTSAYPACDGASPLALALFASISMLLAGTDRRGGRSHD